MRRCLSMTAQTHAIFSHSRTFAVPLVMYVRVRVCALWAAYIAGWPAVLAIHSTLKLPSLPKKLPDISKLFCIL